MALASGSKLGPYEILAPLGAGGMGEVYRARDSRLDRTVAIKVLPPELSANPDRRQRFEREARTISSLNHPHICTLHDIGHQEGIDYLVLEYVEGETLAKKLEGGPLPTEAVLRYGIEIADALDKAHRQGVIHRDLKPGNIMLTRSGAKLLDFGLAKVLPDPGGLLSASTPTAAATASQPLTAEGTIVGTFQYMSPEQVEGKEADARSDLFAFGAVLYEMATGKKAFEGKTTASVLAAVLEREPAAISTLQPMVPPAFDRVVNKCLAKAPDERWQSAKDLHDELKWILEGGSQAGVAAPVATRRRSRERFAWAWAAAATIVVVALALAVVYLRLGSVPAHILVSSILPPPGARFAFVGDPGGPPRISPDGRTLLFVVPDLKGKSLLWVHPLDSSSARALPGTEGASRPFWSPDSRSIGFFADGKLKIVQTSGGPALPLCDAAFHSGGSWNREGTLLFVPKLGAGVYRIPASGGTPSLVLNLDKPNHSVYAWPNFLPDGKHFTYSAWGGEAYTGIYFASLDGRETKLVLRTTGNHAFSSGFLFYSLQTGLVSNLMAQAFDPSTGRAKGEPRSVTEAIEYQPGPNQAAFDVSDTGLLVYRASAAGTSAEWQMAWLDRSGKKLSVVASGEDYYDLRLSPRRS